MTKMKKVEQDGRTYYVHDTPTPSAPSPAISSAVTGEVWENEFVANLLFGANPRSVFVEYEPGNATCYGLLIVPAGAVCEVGTDTYFAAGDCIVTWLGNSKSYTFTLGNIQEGYLAERLEIENRADASQIALFLNHIADARR